MLHKVKNARNILFFVLIFGGVFAPSSFAGEQGHYMSFMNVRDFVQPPEGFYSTFYDIYYHAGEYKDRNGNEVGHISASGSTTQNLQLGHGRDVPITATGNLNVDFKPQIDIFMNAASLAYVSGLEKWGWHYGAIVSPTFGYARINIKGTATANGTLTIGDDITRTVSGSTDFEVKDDKYGFGDLYVAPIWLARHGKRYDAQAQYGFYAPTGAYSEDDIANVGMGFWTHSWGVNGLYYLNDMKATGLMFATTYELHSYKHDKDVRPGQNVTIEYGITQYLHERFEVAAIGSHVWQITEDTGSAVINGNVKDRVNSIGGQFTLWLMNGKLSMTGRCSSEYGAIDRFEGLVSTINFTWIFGDSIHEKFKRQKLS